MPQSSLTVFLPGLQESLQLIDSGSYTAITQWLQCAKTMSSPVELSVLDLLFDQPQSCFSYAGLWAQVGGLGKGNWLIADPVSLELGVNDARLLGGVTPALTAVESQAIFDELAPFFAAYGMTFKNIQNLWLLSCGQHPVQDMQAPDALVGASITPHLPQPSQGVWADLFNTTQMVLYSARVNQERRLKGEATVDALWFWGSGSPMPLSSLQTTFSTVVTDDLRLQGLLMHFDAEVIGLDQWVKQGIYDSRNSGNVLIFCNLLSACDRSVLFKSLIPVIMCNKYHTMRLYTGGDRCYYMPSKKFLNKFWYWVKHCFAPD